MLELSVPPYNMSWLSLVTFLIVHLPINVLEYIDDDDAKTLLCEVINNKNQTKFCDSFCLNTFHYSTANTKSTNLYF